MQEWLGRLLYIIHMLQIRNDLENQLTNHGKNPIFSEY